MRRPQKGQDFTGSHKKTSDVTCYCGAVVGRRASMQVTKSGQCLRGEEVSKGDRLCLDCFRLLKEESPCDICRNSTTARDLLPCTAEGLYVVFADSKPVLVEKGENLCPRCASFLQAKVSCDICGKEDFEGNFRSLHDKFLCHTHHVDRIFVEEEEMAV